MNTETETLINVLRSRMEKMSPIDRLDLVDSLIEGYCKNCGDDKETGLCHCWNYE